MQLRRERLRVPGIRTDFRIVQISDVHFSKSTSHEKNSRITEEILTLCRQAGELHAICVTGDLVSRKWNDTTLPDAVRLMQALGTMAPVLYALGNHETDLPHEQLAALSKEVQKAGVILLHNRTVRLGGIAFTGVTLPGDVYRSAEGSYLRLSTITPEMVEKLIGPCMAHPQILLAHSPLGFASYAQWGADLVLSGHIHGGIVRLGSVGLLSPERRFIPKYTKGLYPDEENGCVMQVSAGIGKLRVNNPAEVVCIDLLPAEVR